MMNLKEYKKFIDMMDWCDLGYFIMQIETDLRAVDMLPLEVAINLGALQYAEEKKQLLIPVPSTVMSYNNLPSLIGITRGH